MEGKTVALVSRDNRVTLSTWGGRIVQWDVADRTGRECQWRTLVHADPSVSASSDWHRSAVMFPWVGRLGGDTWSRKPNTPPIPVNHESPLAHLHGLVHDCMFEVSPTQNDQKVVLTVNLEPNTFYPFRLRLDIEYALLEETLVTRLTCTNLETDPDHVAYVTLGTHPYFRNPYGGCVDEMILQLTVDKAFLLDDHLIPAHVGDIPAAFDFRSPRKVGSGALDNGFRRTRPSSELVRLSINAFTLEICTETKGGWVQAFVPPSREEVALEPQHGAPDAFHHPMDEDYGCAEVPAGESFTFTFRITPTFSAERV